MNSFKNKIRKEQCVIYLLNTCFDILDVDGDPIGATGAETVRKGFAVLGEGRARQGHRAVLRQRVGIQEH